MAEPVLSDADDMLLDMSQRDGAMYEMGQRDRDAAWLEAVRVQAHGMSQKEQSLLIRIPKELGYTLVDGGKWVRLGE